MVKINKDTGVVLEKDITEFGLDDTYDIKQLIKQSDYDLVYMLVSKKRI